MFLSYHFDILRPALVLFSLTLNHVKADFIATLIQCPSNFQRINNGCYNFSITASSSMPDLNWKTADELCRNYTFTDGTVSHLISFESQAESIAISYWLKGSSYTKSFWTDAIKSPSTKKWIWSWNNNSYVNYNYIRQNLDGNDFAYLGPNTTTNLYEIYADAEKNPKALICEAQVPCLPTDNVCQNNGTCYVNGGRVMCVCQSGFEGVYCEKMVDYCSILKPCQHGGSCISKVGTYQCTCTEFYKGINCETEVEDKQSSIRTFVLILFVTLVLSFLVALMIMDLPWELFINKINAMKEKRSSEQHHDEDFENEHPTKAKRAEKKTVPVTTSDQEMLKKFQMAMAQSRISKISSGSSSARTPIQNSSTPNVSSAANSTSELVRNKKY